MNMKAPQVPPGVTDNAMNRWACARCGTVRGQDPTQEPIRFDYIEDPTRDEGGYRIPIYPFVEWYFGEPCEEGIGRCWELGCPKTGRCEACHVDPQH